MIDCNARKFRFEQRKRRSVDEEDEKRWGEQIKRDEDEVETCHLRESEKLRRKKCVRYSGRCILWGSNKQIYRGKWGTEQRCSRGWEAWEWEKLFERKVVFGWYAYLVKNWNFFVKNIVNKCKS